MERNEGKGWVLDVCDAYNRQPQLLAGILGLKAAVTIRHELHCKIQQPPPPLSPPPPPPPLAPPLPLPLLTARSARTSVWPSAFAWSYAVSPSSSSAFWSAPFSSNKGITPERFVTAAECSGVDPDLVFFESIATPSALSNSS
mmetsp:Transcript_39383/g.97624  ORF Transcript_39383/g.97624 Transcript_39383/m.97624 type:complete len:143 (-) Transcript_39383:321-749(-)